MDKNLEDLVALIDEPGQQTEFRALLEKSEKLQTQLKEGILRQSDYDRLMNAAKEDLKTKQRVLDTKVEDYTKLHADNVKWREDNVKKVKEAETARQTAERARADAEKKLQDALSRNPAIAEGEVTKEQVEAEVRKVLEGTGVLSPTQIDSVVTSKVDEVVKKATDNFYQVDLPAATQFQMDMVDTAYSHQREFGTPLDREKFANFMRENNIRDPKKAYEQFTSDAKKAKELEAEREKIRKEEADKVRQEYSRSSVPGADGGSEVGAVAARQQREAAQATGGGASAAAAELRQEGKA